MTKMTSAQIHTLAERIVEMRRRAVRNAERHTRRSDLGRHLHGQLSETELAGIREALRAD